MSHLAIRDYLRAAVGTDPGGAADAELLARFAASRDEAAFELLVWRHAALVQRVCRAVLRDHHAAEDAAQAAFLVLARKAHTFANRGSVVGWLYRVARRIAIRLAKDRARRAASSDGLDRVPDASPESEAGPDEVATLCAEVDRLPEPYRIPVLLCFFEGLTHAEAARRTGWPIGTVAGRLARAKELLARRLSHKGVGLASVAVALPAGSFVGSTAQAASAFAAAEHGHSRCRTIRSSPRRRSTQDHDHNDLETDRRERRGGVRGRDDVGNRRARRAASGGRSRRPAAVDRRRRPRAKPPRTSASPARNNAARASTT